MFRNIFFLQPKHLNREFPSWKKKLIENFEWKTIRISLVFLINKRIKCFLMRKIKRFYKRNKGKKRPSGA